MKRTKPSAKPFSELWIVKALTLKFGGRLQWLLVIDLFRNQHSPLSNPPSPNQLPSPRPQLFSSKLVLPLRPGKSVSPVKWSLFFDPIGFYVMLRFLFQVGGWGACLLAVAASAALGGVIGAPHFLSRHRFE